MEKRIKSNLIWSRRAAPGFTQHGTGLIRELGLPPKAWKGFPAAWGNGTLCNPSARRDNGFLNYTNWKLISSLILLLFFLLLLLCDWVCAQVIKCQQGGDQQKLALLQPWKSRGGGQYWSSWWQEAPAQLKGENILLVKVRISSLTCLICKRNPVRPSVRITELCRLQL